MKPSQFVYFEPTTLHEALTLLDQHGDDAKVLSGGQSLIPALNFRLSAPAYLIDINRLSELDYIRADGESVVLGALTRHRTLERSPLVQERLPLLHEAAGWIGHAAIRTRGTLGGSLAHADPAAELPVVMVALSADFTVESLAEGTREIPATEFYLNFLTTALGPADLLTSVRIPSPPVNMGWAFHEISRRHGDFALVAVAAGIAVGADGRVTEARVALGGVSPTPVRSTVAEESLVGQVPSQQLFAAAAQAAAAELDPDGDLHASADLRRHLAANLIASALASASQRSKGGDLA
jgi:CO/xanthine dehydrogenase FAD-binding subunit